MQVQASSRRYIINLSEKKNRTQTRWTCFDQISIQVGKSTMSSKIAKKKIVAYLIRIMQIK